MTPTKEDYISSIFKQIEDKGHATNIALSKYLGVSKPSVTEMVRRLKEEGYVYSEGRKLLLTEKGMDLGKKNVSIHRLWERFLKLELQYGDEDVHREADLLEHATSDKLLDAMNAYLGYPKTCPHGGRIYINENIKN